MTMLMKCPCKVNLTYLFHTSHTHMICVLAAIVKMLIIN